MWDMFSMYKNNQKSKSVRTIEQSSELREWVTDSSRASYRYDYNEAIDDDEDPTPPAFNAPIGFKRPVADDDISSLKKFKMAVAAEKSHDMMPGIPLQQGSLGADLHYHYENEPIDDDFPAVSRLETHAWSFNRYFQSDGVVQKNKFTIENK